MILIFFYVLVLFYSILKISFRSVLYIFCYILLIIQFLIGDWNAKVASQDILGVTGKFGLGVQNEAVQRLIDFCQENTQVIANTLFQQHKRRLYTSPDG